jgi:hypothetical protein
MIVDNLNLYGCNLAETDGEYPEDDGEYPEEPIDEEHYDPMEEYCNACNGCEAEMITDFESGNMDMAWEHPGEMNDPNNWENGFIQPTMSFNIEWVENEYLPAGHYLMS